MIHRFEGQALVLGMKHCLNFGQWRASLRDQGQRARLVKRDPLQGRR